MHPDLRAIVAKTHPVPGADLPGLRRTGRRRLRPQEGMDSFHHLMGRITADTPFFDETEKEALVLLMRRLSAFCGLDLLTYAVMGNHFHAVVRAPDPEAWGRRFAGPEGEEALLHHLGVLYSRRYIAHLRASIGDLRRTGRDEAARAVLDSFRLRFCRPGVWAKEVQQRFARWLNRRRGRKGVLWMGRYKDVLVEEGTALRTIACYVDLNPVRAGLASDPGSYRWCAIGAFAAGDQAVGQGITRLVALGGGNDHDAVNAAAIYRAWIQESEAKHPRRAEAPPSAGTPGGPSFATGHDRDEMAVQRPLLQRIRHFGAGLAIGSQAWVESVFRLNRGLFGPRRTSGARRVRALPWALCSLRDLRKNVVGPPP